MVNDKYFMLSFLKRFRYVYFTPKEHYISYVIYDNMITHQIIHYAKVYKIEIQGNQAGILSHDQLKPQLILNTMTQK